MIFKRLKTYAHGFALALCVAGVGGPVYAADIALYSPDQEKDPAKSWTKPPIKFGSFLLFSDITVSEQYNDNILAQETAKTSDFVTSIAPRAQLVKSIGRHNFALAFGTNGKRYLQNHDENLLDYSGAFLADIEAYHNFHIPFKLGYGIEHQDRTNRRITSVTERPVEFSRAVAESGFTYQPNRLKLEFLGKYEQIRVENSKLLVSGASIDARDKAKDSVELSTTVSYETQTSWRPILKIIYNTQNYLRRALTATGFDGTNRNSETLRTLAGIGFDYKGLISGNILLGPEKHRYEEPGAEPVSGFASEVVIKFAPTRKMTGELDFSKRSYDDNLLLSGLTETSYGLQLGYEINSRWNANLKGSYSNTEFLTSTRIDDEYAATGSLVYNINRGLSLEGSYGYQMRDSSAPSLSYDQNTVMLTLKNTF